MIEAEETVRAFKTAWFAKAASKALIKDDQLCEAIREVTKGHADDLGGGVFKKRLDRNRHRASSSPRVDGTGCMPICSQKKDRSNIDEAELNAFRQLAGLYARKSDEQIERELAAKELVEICNDHET